MGHGTTIFPNRRWRSEKLIDPPRASKRLTGTSGGTAPALPSSMIAHRVSPRLPGETSRHVRNRDNASHTSKPAAGVLTRWDLKESGSKTRGRQLPRPFKEGLSTNATRLSSWIGQAMTGTSLDAMELSSEH